MSIREIAKHKEVVHSKETTTSRISQGSPEKQFEEEKLVRKSQVTKTESDCHVHTVKKGESLWAIAKKLGFKDNEIVDAIKAIAKENDIKDPSKLRIGQELRIPFDFDSKQKVSQSVRTNSDSAPKSLTNIHAEIAAPVVQSVESVKKAAAAQNEVTNQPSETEEEITPHRKGAWEKLKGLAHGAKDRASHLADRILHMKRWSNLSHMEKISQYEGLEINTKASVYATRANDDYRIKHNLDIDGYAGRKTSSGIRMEPDLPIVAHRSLPFGTKLLIEANGKQVIGVVADRGPFHKNKNHQYDRDLDFSTSIAKQLNMSPVDSVKATVIG